MQSEKQAVFIDGGHLYGVSRALQFDVDYRKLLEFFRRRGHVIRAYYYTAILGNDEYSPLKPLTDWLAYNGYSVLTRTAKEATDGQGHRRILGNAMDLDIAADMFELAPHLDRMTLVTGSGGFRRPIEAIQRCGVQVSLMSSFKTTPPMVADELRRIVDQFIELEDVKQEFIRQRQTDVLAPPSVPPKATPADPFGEGDSPPTRPTRRTRTSATA